MKIKIFFTALFAIVLFTACSGYNKVVKGDNYEEKFKLADELYNKKQTLEITDNSKKRQKRRVNRFDRNRYTRCIALCEQIYQRVPRTGEGELAYYRLGKCYYAVKDYSMAGYYFNSFYQRFPMSAKAEETLFLSAMCSVFNSPEYSLDQNDTELAINDLQQFINQFPNSTLIDSCNHLMDKMRFKLETKDYHMVLHYSKTENFNSAIASGETFFEDYPRSVFREEVFYLIVKNSALLAKNSIDEKKKQRIEETLERYRNFVTEFPKSKYKKEVDSVSDEMQKELQEFTSQK